MNLTNEEMGKLEAAKSTAEWNDCCDEIKRARGGQYPPDWYQRVIMTGLAQRVGSLRITTFN